MIPGFDVSKYQVGLNYPLAFQQGYRACYVKLGGDNITPRYVSDSYVGQVDAARAAGERVGHYWVPSAYLDPVGAADYFTAHLHGWTRADFVVLDNETLNPRKAGTNGNGLLFSDAQAATWVRRVASNLGIPTTSVFVYIGADVLRTHVWPELEALGIKLIVASYGKNTGVRDHEPFLAGRFGGVWAGHQYSSNGTVGGFYPVDVDVFQDWAFVPVTPIPTFQENDNMLAFTCPELLQNWNFLIWPGFIKNAPSDQANHYASEAGSTVKTWTAARVADELWNHGLAEFIPDGSPIPLKAFLQSLTGGQFRVASWLTGVTQAQLAEALQGVTLQAPVSPAQIAVSTADEIDERSRQRLAADTPTP